MRDQEVQVAETNGEISGFLAMREDMVEHPGRRFYEHHGLRVIEETDGSRNEERTPDALYEWGPTDP